MPNGQGYSFPYNAFYSKIERALAPPYFSPASFSRTFFFWVLQRHRDKSTASSQICVTSASKSGTILCKKNFKLEKKKKVKGVKNKKHREKLFFTINMFFLCDHKCRILLMNIEVLCKSVYFCLIYQSASHDGLVKRDIKALIHKNQVFNLQTL